MNGGLNKSKDLWPCYYDNLSSELDHLTAWIVCNPFTQNSKGRVVHNLEIDPKTLFIAFKTPRNYAAEISRQATKQRKYNFCLIQYMGHLKGTRTQLLKSRGYTHIHSTPHTEIHTQLANALKILVQSVWVNELIGLCSALLSKITASKNYIHQPPKDCWSCLLLG